MKVACRLSDLELGDRHRIDPDVVIGYLPDRRIADLRLFIGADARLRSGTVIYAGSRFGDGLETGHHVVLREELTVGRQLSVWNNTTVDYGTTIGDRVRLHTNVYVAQFTTIGDDVFLAPGVTIANDLHPGRDYSKRAMRGPRLLSGAQVGVNCTILPYVTIGAGALIGAGAVVTRDVAPGMLAYGNPARAVKPVADLAAADLSRWLGGA